ncbi:MAG: hypothetical protein WDW38_005813 [Sanguina aurantia]
MPAAAAVQAGQGQSAAASGRQEAVEMCSVAPCTDPAAQSRGATRFREGAALRSGDAYRAAAKAWHLAAVERSSKELQIACEGDSSDPRANPPPTQDPARRARKSPSKAAVRRTGTPAHR